MIGSGTADVKTNSESGSVRISHPFLPVGCCGYRLEGGLEVAKGQYLHTSLLADSAFPVFVVVAPSIHLLQNK